MLIGNRIARSVVCGIALLAAGCSSGGSGATATVSGAVQNLTLDPTGLTTVITLSQAFEGIGAGNLQADGGQTAQNLSTSGSALTVVWSARVTPSHQVRVVGVPGLSDAWRAVTTTDSSPPLFAIDSATQNAGLGGDEIEISFSGPNVAASTVVDPASWELVVNSHTLDLTLSVFDFDAGTQTLSIVLSPLANLHSSFSLAASGVRSVADVLASSAPVIGAASGDTTEPNLLSAVQNLTADEYGRVVDFTFDKAMDPIACAGLSRYSVPSPNTAIQVEQPSREILRVSFATPVIPGMHQVTLNGLLDSHGNALADGPTAVSQPSPVANAFDVDPVAVTVANAGGDYVTFSTLQAFDVASAEDPARWILAVDGATIDLAEQTLTYDFLARTLVIELAFDMLNGTPFAITGNGTLEVDGQTFSGAFTGTVDGDQVPPTVSRAVQNRNFDPSGLTLQVSFSEGLDKTSAEDAGNYGLSDNSITVLTASLLPTASIVRLTLDSLAVPGAVTLSVDGVRDLAGNPMSAPQTGITITSTDIAPPALTGAVASAIEGADNDTLVVTFSDQMVTDDVQDLSKWSLQSPIGSGLDLTGCTVAYSQAGARAVLTLDAGGLSLVRDTDFRVTLSGMRDIGGNSIGSVELSGDVLFESDRPSIVAVWRVAAQTNQVELRFSEPCAYLTDLYDPLTNHTGTRYTLMDGVIERGRPLSATLVDDGLGVRLSFGFLVSLADTLDVFGVADLAGNYLPPAASLVIAAEDTSVPSFEVGSSTLTAVSGEANDEVSFVFDVPMSPWRLLEPSNYTLSDGGPSLPLQGAQLSFDGDRTVTVRFVAGSDVNLQVSSLYDITVSGVQSAQGVLRSVSDTESNLPVGGDALGPVVGLSDVRLDPLFANSLLVFADEALDADFAEDPLGYVYDFGWFATEALRLSPRVVRVTFPVPVQAGDPLELTLRDLAGNSSGSLVRTIATADSQAPLLAGVQGLSVSGVGGDELRISFDEPVDPISAFDPANYTVTNGGSPVSLAGSTMSWESGTLTVVIHLGHDVALDPSQAMSFTVRNVADWSGNAMPPGGVSLGGAAMGDTTPPAVAAAFVNWREEESGRAIDVLFSEDVSTAFSGYAPNWSSSGGQLVNEVRVLEHDSVRIFLSAPLLAGQQLQLAGGLPDPAGNTAGTLIFTPER